MARMGGYKKRQKMQQKQHLVGETKAGRSLVEVGMGPTCRGLRASFRGLGVGANFRGCCCRVGRCSRG